MALETNWNSGGSKQTPHPKKEKSLRDLLHVLTGVTVAQLKAMSQPQQRYDGMQATIGAYTWVWNATSTLTGDDHLVITPSDTPTAGRWLLAPGQHVLFNFPITYATADTTALLTVPTGCIIKPREFWWRITADFTGGSSSAIGVSSSNAAFNTQGDFLGGAIGDVAADLQAADDPQVGTIGAAFDTLAKRRAFLVASNTVRFDRITSAFTAGTGAVEMLADVIQNDGA